MVAGDVTRAHGAGPAAAARVVQADRALRTAIITFNGNYEGLQQTTRLGNVLVLVNRPQEAVFALQLLKLAFDEYFTTVADYNRAQFELYPRAGLPGPRNRTHPAARRDSSGGYHPPALLARRGQRAAPCHALITRRLRMKTTCLPVSCVAGSSFDPCTNARHKISSRPRATGREATAQCRFLDTPRRMSNPLPGSGFPSGGHLGGCSFWC